MYRLLYNPVISKNIKIFLIFIIILKLWLENQMQLNSNAALQQIPITLEEELRRPVYSQIFSKYLNLSYTVNSIVVNKLETMHTIFLPCVNKDLQNKENFFMGHGFGGSSLMNFPLFTDLLDRGNVILMEIRGMGFSDKLQSYTSSDQEGNLNFFLDGFSAVLEFYSFGASIFIMHSFSSYLLLAFTLRREQQARKYIKEMLLFSPIGITTKYEDYKFKDNSCANYLRNLYFRAIWSLELNQKTPFRLFCCCKEYSIRKNMKQLEIDQMQELPMFTLLSNFVETADGSQNLFFDLFQPQVLPKIPLEPMIVKEPFAKITIVYGGEDDWVDKTGAKKIAERFPEQIKKIDMQGLTHNIPFHISSCKQLFKFIFG